MQNPRLASRYAKSLLDLAVEQNSLEATLKDVQLLDSICRQSHDFVSMLRSPVIRADKKLQVVDAVFASADGISKLTRAFIALLTNKSREANLPEIARSFISQYKELKQIRTIKLTTAVPVEDAVKNAILSRISADMSHASVELNVHVDADIIGGFVLETDDKLFDASIRKDLNDIKSRFLKNSYVSELR